MMDGWMHKLTFYQNTTESDWLNIRSMYDKNKVNVFFFFFFKGRNKVSWVGDILCVLGWGGTLRGVAIAALRSSNGATAKTESKTQKRWPPLQYSQTFIFTPPSTDTSLLKHLHHRTISCIIFHSFIPSAGQPGRKQCPTRGNAPYFEKLSCRWSQWQ